MRTGWNRLLLSTEYPSWGYLVAHGATTMWERWNGDNSLPGAEHQKVNSDEGTIQQDGGALSGRFSSKSRRR